MFIFETNQSLEQLEQIVIQGENGFSPDCINELFRHMHTVKGSSSMMLFTSISAAAHVLEDLFAYLREENPRDIDFSLLTDYVLEGMDFIKEELAVIEAGGTPSGDPSAIIAKTKKFLAAIKGEPQLAPEPEIPQTAAGLSGAGGSTYSARITFAEGCEMENVRAFTLLRNLKPHVFDLSHEPEDVINEGAVDFIRKNGFKLRFSTALPYAEIHEILMQTVYLKDLQLQPFSQAAEPASDRYFVAVLQFEDGSEMENVRAFGVVHRLKSLVTSLTHTPEDLVDEAATAAIRENGFIMRIVTDMSYDSLYNTLSETLYLRDMSLEERYESTATSLQQVLDKTPAQAAEVEKIIKQAPVPTAGKPVQVEAKPTPKPIGPAVISVNVGKLDALLKLLGELVIAEAMVTQNPELESLALESFHKEVRQLRKIVKDLQDTVLSMRMVALSTTFFKMNRIVRDMCKQLDKEIHLEIIGEETEVDKNIIEHISDPLMHIIRNSVDHGIEMPQNRLSAGKNRTGRIVLEARNAGSDVLISVRDDGAGLNKDRIMEKAKTNGLLRKLEYEYSDKEIYQFIFMPGFSTSAQVTSFSGRGVGMDVVSKNLDAVGGVVLVESTPGEGSSFTLKIPTTLAIIEGMIIRVGGRMFTVPITTICGSFRPSAADVFTDPNGNEMINVGGDCYNIVRLHTHFGIENAVTNLEKGIMMIVENGDEAICLFVDGLIGEQQVVVKSMPRYIKRMREISGCTLLGNGDISLIIDVAGFFD